MSVKTQINGVEITPGMAAIFEKWYGDAISYDDTLPFGYVKELGEVQDFLCRKIECKMDKDLATAISIIMSIKDDLRCFIPTKEEFKKKEE